MRGYVDGAAKRLRERNTIIKRVLDDEGDGRDIRPAFVRTLLARTRWQGRRYVDDLISLNYLIDCPHHLATKRLRIVCGRGRSRGW